MASDSQAGDLQAALRRARRRPLELRSEEMVRIGPLLETGPLPLLVEAAVAGSEAVAWVADNRAAVERGLAGAGGLLLRGFRCDGEAALERLIVAMSGEPAEYTYRSTPRTRLGGRIYTSTEYPADESIPFHNEMSYTTEWPKKIWFLCLQPAATGGETPIADSRRVLSRLAPELRRRFAEHGVMYVRNYGGGLDLSWQDVFQTADRAAVERICGDLGIRLEWLSGDRLRTRQVCRAVLRHPDTGEEVWFNQAHLFHVSSLRPEMRQLLSALPEDELPRNTYYGDGSPIEPATLAAIRDAYAQEEVVFPWRQGDLLILDNILVAHSRRPYGGARRVVVGMAELMR